MKKRTTKSTLARAVSLGFKGLYRGIAGLIDALRTEMHERFDRLEQLVLPEYKRRVEKSERKVK